MGRGETQAAVVNIGHRQRGTAPQLYVTTLLDLLIPLQAIIARRHCH